MTAAQMKIAFVVGGVIVLWLLARAAKAAAADPGRVTKEATICADLLEQSCTFGDPIDPIAPAQTAEQANHQRLLDLVAESEAQIANWDANHPEAPTP